MASENNFMLKYHQALSQGIEEVWQDESFSDIVIKIGTKSYNCHRLVLASLSAYFNAMFRSGMKETVDGSADLQNIEPEIFEAVLKFMYSGCNVITQENVERLLEAAVMLQISCLQEQCESYLKNQIGPDNCLGIWQLASNLSCASLKKKTWTYILEFFPAILNTEEYSQISADDLIEIINDNDLNTSSEEAVCNAVLKWVEIDPQNRGKSLGKLFHNIRFPLISVKYVKELSKNEMVKNNEECQLLLKNVYDYLTSKDSDASGTKYLSEMSRQMHYRQEEMMCVVGTRSRHPNPQATEIKCFSFRRDAEYTLAALPQEPGACFAVCKYKDDVYVSGGYHGQNLVLQFVSSDNRWQHCSPLLEGRWGHSMIEVGGNIYVIGGSTRLPQTLSSIECYDTKRNEWKLAGGLQIPVSFMPTAAIGNKIYVFGGKLQDRTLSTKVQCFDVKKRMCFVMEDMPLMASTASRVTVLDDAVYIFYRHGDIVEYKEGSSATIIGNMPHFDHYGVVPHEGQILIVGCQSNQYSTVMFNPITRDMTPYSRTVKAALCNFYCMPIVISRQHINSSDTEEQK
ncbi:Kelch-like protein 41 [Mactra antiquata]